MGVGDQRHDSAAFLPGKRPVPIVQEAGWAGLDGRGKPLTHRDLFTGPSSR
jgi:hypothetical protein